MDKMATGVFRTCAHKIHVADYEICSDDVRFLVKHKALWDSFTLKELMQEVYGKNTRIVIYGTGENIIKVF